LFHILLLAVFLDEKKMAASKLTIDY